MNIQIFGKSKCFDTKKAERYFKERRQKFQSIDLIKYGISRGELQSVARATGGLDNLVDETSKEYANQHLAYLADKSDLEDRILEAPALLKTPIVRNGKQATVGYAPDVWATWA